jgi:hypothetical protein
MLDILIFILKFNMSYDVKGIMAKHFSMNPVFRLWKYIIFFLILNERLNKYMKLAKIEKWFMCWGLLRMKEHSTISHS